MSTCCIIGCNSNYCQNDEGLSFFRFPRKKGLRNLWIKKIGSENIKHAKVIKICSKHFKESCINRTLGVIRLKDDVVPTVFLPSTSIIDPVFNKDLVSEDPCQANTTCLSPCNPIPMNVVYINRVGTGQVETTSMDINMSAHTGESPIPMPINVVYIKPVCTGQVEPTGMNVNMSANTGESPIEVHQ